MKKGFLAIPAVLAMLLCTAGCSAGSAGNEHTITIDDNIENGTVEVDKSTAAADDTFTVTATPDDGYELSEIVVYRSSDNVQYNSSTTSPATIIMGNFDVIVTAEFTQTPQKEMSSTEIAEYLDTRVNQVITDQATGSGFFIDDQGTFVTNYHVIEYATEISIKMSTGASYEVEKIIDFSPFLDLAVVKAKMSGNDYLDICTDGVKQGESVYAMGSPLNEMNSFTTGTVSAVSRTFGIKDCIQTDAAINSGNSGGPLVNSKGQVVGINSYSLVDAESMNLALNVSLLNQLSMDKNYTVERFNEWFTTEMDKCYGVEDTTDSSYYYCYVRTYQTVTGQECLGSTDDFENITDGYVECYQWYVYTYDETEYNTYCDYLTSIGYSYDSFEEGGSDGFDTTYYYNDDDGYLIDLMLDTADNLIVVGCPYYTS